MKLFPYPSKIERNRKPAVPINQHSVIIKFRSNSPRANSSLADHMIPHSSENMGDYLPLSEFVE